MRWIIRKIRMYVHEGLDDEQIAVKLAV